MVRSKAGGLLVPYSHLLQVGGNRRVPGLQTVCTSRCGWLGGPVGTQSWLPAWRRTQCSCDIRDILCVGTETLSLPPPGAGQQHSPWPCSDSRTAKHAKVKGAQLQIGPADVLRPVLHLAGGHRQGPGASNHCSRHEQLAVAARRQLQCIHMVCQAQRPCPEQPNTEVTSAQALRAVASEQQLTK